MMMDSAPRRSEALTGVNQQLNERTTSLEEPNIPTMVQYILCFTSFVNSKFWLISKPNTEYL